MREPIGVLVMAYGGPRSVEEVEPYLQQVRGGRPTPPQVLQEVIHRYEAIGGGSPILEETRRQANGLRRWLPDSWPVYVAMRHWRPFLGDVAAQAAGEGVRSAVGLVMAPHYSRLSVEAYFEELDKAIRSRALDLQIHPIKSWKDDRGYLETLEARVRQGLERFPAERQAGVHLVLTAHSLPEKILSWADPYPDELRATFDELTRRFPDQPAHFAYQSAAMTKDAWLGPDAGELMVGLIEGGASDFLVVPIGFVCEHVEILYDVDIDFRRRVESAGGRLERIEMPGADERMMRSLAERVRRAAAEAGWL
jgi:ferrochelatase